MCRMTQTTHWVNIDEPQYRFIWRGIVTVWNQLLCCTTSVVMWQQRSIDSIYAIYIVYTDSIDGEIVFIGFCFTFNKYRFLIYDLLCFNVSIYGALMRFYAFGVFDQNDKKNIVVYKTDSNEKWSCYRLFRSLQQSFGFSQLVRNTKTRII